MMFGALEAKRHNRTIYSFYNVPSASQSSDDNYVGTVKMYIYIGYCTHILIQYVHVEKELYMYSKIRYYNLLPF